MDQHRIFIVGDSLFAHNMVETLSSSDAVQVVGIAPSLESVASWLHPDGLDAIIVAGTTEEDHSANFGPLVIHYPELPIIRTTLSTNKVQVITSQCIRARMPDLLELITALPKRS